MGINIMDPLPRLNKIVISVTTFNDMEEEKFWLSINALERVEAVELDRRLISGKNRTTSRLQRSLETYTLASIWICTGGGRCRLVSPQGIMVIRERRAIWTSGLRSKSPMLKRRLWWWATVIKGYSRLYPEKTILDCSIHGRNCEIHEKRLRSPLLWQNQ